VSRIDEVKKSARCAVESLEDQAWDLALQMHENPEIGFEEKLASERLTEFLQECGFSVTRQIAGMETSFVARHDGGDGPTVAILAEYDALPGMGHACGHNIIGAAAVLAGASVKRAMESEGAPCGTVLVVGAPAEEGAVDNAGGKVFLAEDDIFDDVDCAMMIHPSTAHRPRGSSLAREALELSYHGKAAHAASGPEHGRNALDAAILSFNAWNALRQHVTDDVRIHGVITEGGSAPNIVPDFAQVRMYVRAEDVDYLDEVVERVKESARGAARGAGCEVQFRQTANRYANLICNDPLAETYAENLSVLGISADHTPRRGGSTDMGNVSQIVPSIHPYVAIAPEGVAGHSTEFVAASASEEGREGMRLGASALAMTALDCLYDEELLAAVRRDFCRD